MKENDVQFLNTNKYPFKKRVFIDGDQVLVNSEKQNISLDMDYEDMMDHDHIVLMISGNVFNFFGAEDVIINNSSEDNHHTLLITFDDILDIAEAESKGETYKSCEFCIDGYITTITKASTALVIMCFEVPLEFETTQHPAFPVLLQCEAPNSVHQLSYNTAKKDIFTSILLNDHDAPSRYTKFPNSGKEDTIKMLCEFMEDLRDFTYNMGISVGHWYMMDNFTSEYYHGEWKSGPRQIVQLRSLNIMTDTENDMGDDCVFETKPEGAFIKSSLIDFMLDIRCMVLPGHTLVCTPERSYMITTDGENDVNIDIAPTLFEISDDKVIEEKRDIARRFVFTDYLNDHTTPGQENYLIGVMFDKDGEMIWYSHHYAKPDDGTTKPTEIRITE